MPTKRTLDQRRGKTKNFSLSISLQPNDPNEENNTTVKGTLDVESKADALIHGILLTVHGEVWAEITSSATRNNGDQKYSSNIFVQSNYVFGKGSATSVLPQGKHSFPFTFCLPPHLPSSFEGSFGGISYMVTAKIHSDNERNDNANKVSETIQVRRFLSLSDGSAYGNSISFPTSLERPQKTLRTTLVPNQSQLKYIFKIQKTGFASGEIIPFVLDLYNPERKKLSSMSVTLMKKTVYGDLKYSMDVFEELAEVNTLTIDNLKSTLTWIGSLHVPQNVIPTHSVIAAVPKKKPIFSHKYLLRVKLIPCIGTYIIGDMPIVIGTTKYECRPRRQTDHCCRSYSVTTRETSDRQATEQRFRQSSVPPSYSQTIFNPERRPSLETLPPPYEEAIAMASRVLAKETRHLMG